MASKRHLRALEVLHQIKDHELQDVSQSVRALLTRQASLERERESLDALARQEAENCPPEMREYLVSYLQQLSKRQAELSALIDNMHAEAETAQTQLSEAFVESKTIAHLLDTARAELRDALRAREAAEAAVRSVKTDRD